MHCSSTYQPPLEAQTRLCPSIQAGNFVKWFDQDTRLNVLKIGNIPPVEISLEHVVAMKVDLAIPSEKVKAFSRYFV